MLKKWQIPLTYLFLAAAALIAFWRVTGCGFINFDDPAYVTGNVHIRHGITMEAIRWAFTTGYAANWHPLTWMSHMLDIQLFGLNPRWHHLTNLLFHIANTLLLFSIFRRMTGAPWKSAMVAALFALHPLHVESVAWVAERKDVLSTFFWMLTTAAYIRYVDRPGLGNYLAVPIFFALGLMSKPMLVTLPFVLLLLDYWPLERFELENSARRGTGREEEALKSAGEGWKESPAGGAKRSGSAQRKPPSAKKRKEKSSRKRTGRSATQQGRPAVRKYRWKLVFPMLREKIPLFALSALSCIVTYVVQQEGGAVQSMRAFPFGARIANAFVSYVIYIAKTIWPVHLAVFYPYLGPWPLWQVLGAVLILAAVTAAVIWKAKRVPYLAVGWFWFTGTLVPVIGIVQVGEQAMADRYTYVPLIGLFVMAAWGVPELLRKWRPAFPYRREALFALSALVLASLSILTWRQTGYWRNSISLYDHALSVTSRNYLILTNRGAAYYDLGRPRQAISDYDEAIEINPESVEAYSNRGLAYCKLGRYRQAVSDCDKSIALNPEYANAYGNRGTAYSKLGNNRQAVSDFSRAIRINPDLAWTYNGRGKAYGRLGKPERAIEDFDRAVELDPKYAEAYNNLGVARNMLGNYRQAISDYDRALAIKPKYADAYYNRGVAYGALGNARRAIADYDKAIEINPRYADAYNNRGAAYESLGDRKRAIRDLRKAARLGSEDAKRSLSGIGMGW